MHIREGAHQSVVRSAVTWTPIFIASTAGSVSFALIAIDSPGTWVIFAITALTALLSGVSALGALRDIYAEPIQTTGVIERKWRKSDVLIFRGHYVLCRKRVFRVPREVYDELPEVGGGVLLEHYPHTSALTAWATAQVSTVTNETDQSGDGEEQDQSGRPTRAAAQRVSANQPSIVEGDLGRTMPPAPSSDRPSVVRDPLTPHERLEPPSFGDADDDTDTAR